MLGSQAQALMSFINLTGCHCCAFDYNLNYNSNEIQQAIKHMRVHAFFIRCRLLCPSQSSASVPVQAPQQPLQCHQAESAVSLPTSLSAPTPTPIPTPTRNPRPSAVADVLATLELTMTCSNRVSSAYLSAINVQMHSIYLYSFSAFGFTNCFH